MLFLSGVAMAQGGASQTLQQVAKYVKSLGRYEVSFTLLAGEYSAKGYFRVDGDSYYMTVGTSEVYCDGKVRYEVDNNREEVNVDNVDLTSRNVLDNPTRCFDFVDSGYESKMYAQDGAETTIHLRSTDPAIEGDIFLTVDATTAKPKRLEYKLYDDVIVVDVLSLKKRAERVKSFNKSSYKDYEMIDFR
jgi:hypothetical protein